MTENFDVTELTAEIVAAYVSKNPVVQADVAKIIRSTHAALHNLTNPDPEPKGVRPAVSVRSSVNDARITCLNCGKSFKTIKRHLKANHDMSPEAYRKFWDLKPDYPMVAPNYTNVRSEMAKKAGLGRKPR